MPVLDFYKGKNLFLTGCTGFLGKVLLEKFLRCLPGIKTIYVLIRSKKGSTPMERFKKEIIGSPCFDKARKLNKNFDEYVSHKVVAIAGDILKEGLDLAPQDLQMLIDNVNIVMHCAASIEFNARFDAAIQVNVRGTLRMKELCHKMKHLENFLHVSTAYVNSDKRGLIEEDIYDIEGDAMEIINEIEKIPVNQMEAATKEILGDYPNTYTFTKSMSERIIKKTAGDLTITICRPSIIGSSWKEPSRGWVDTVSAGGALYLLIGLGILRHIPVDLNHISDQVPVDLVVDWMIVAGACYANSKKVNVVHITSSQKNPVTWGTVREEVCGYWVQNPPDQAMAKANIQPCATEREFAIQSNIRRIPAMLYLQVAKLSRNANMKKNAVKWNKMILRARRVGDQFKHFTKFAWVFKTEKVDEMTKYCTPEELKIFQMDMTVVDWPKFFHFFCWGLQTHILKESVEEPESLNRRNLLSEQLTRTYFSDIKWAYTSGVPFTPRPAHEMKSLIMTSPRVQEALRNLVTQRKDKKLTDDQFTKRAIKKANKICEQMFSTYSMPMLRTFAWFLHHVFKQIYEKVVVDESKLQKLMTLDSKAQGPMVIIPTHRSYIDFLLVSYIFFEYGLKCPHIAAAEDFLSIIIVHRLLRSSGAFFIKRKQNDDMAEVYKAILYEYVQRLLLEDSSLEFFIEGTRSRSGKTSGPKFGILQVVTDTYFDKKLPDVQIIPVSINYERVLESETFPFELLGEEKVKESLGRIVRAANILTMSFGRVYVDFNEPISLKEYTAKFINNTSNVNDQPNTGNMMNQIVPVKAKRDPLTNKQDRQELLNNLGYDIVYKINETLVLMPTSLVASILLMNRKGISETSLINKVEWLTNEIIMRGGKIGTINESGASVAVRNAVGHLDGLVNRKKDIFHPSLSAKADYKNILLLSYYRNMLVHLFLNESICACALVAFGRELAWKEGVTLDRLWEEVSFLQKLIGKEYVIQLKLDEKNFKGFIEQMIDYGVFSWTSTAQQGKIKVASEESVSFLCHLVWPFIESYWITCVFLFSLKSTTEQLTLPKFIEQVQWFAESLYEERIIEFYESCSQDTIKNALHVFKEGKVIAYEKVTVGKSNETADVIKLLMSEEALKGIEDHIAKFLKNSYAKTVSSPIDIARKSMLVDYPFMSKL